MSELIAFENPEFGQVRTTVIDGEPWFVGKDVAQALGYKEPTKAARERVDQEDRGVSEMDTPSGKQELLVINESGLYSLMLTSKLPSAKAFRRWVTSEVIPSIRKTGGYVAAAQPLSDQEILERASSIMTRESERLKFTSSMSKYLPVADDGGVKFMLRTSILPHVELLTEAEIGKLFLAILNYVSSGEEKPELEGGTLMAFAFIRTEIESDLVKYQKRCQTARINGRKGGRPKKNVEE